MGRKRCFTGGWLAVGLTVVVVVVMLVVGLGSCTDQAKQSESLPMDFMSGEFSFAADTAVFRNCATGRSYPVASGDERLRAEKEYTALAPGVGEGVYVRLRGHIDSLPSSRKGEGNVPTIVIDSLLGFDRDANCTPDGVMQGVYESGDGEGRTVLHLRGDYTFSMSAFQHDGTETRTTGLWGLTAELELGLLPLSCRQETINGKDTPLPVPGQMLFQRVPEQETFIRNNGASDDSGVFKKVYL